MEDTSNAVALIQALSAETRLPIVPVVAKGSKESRVEGVTGTLEAGKVYLLLSFPLGKHDDMCDSFVLALSKVTAKSIVPDFEAFWF